ncbi:Major facilitator superfamily MFS_1 OS=Tsukamurella paurometabola (strain ATCC 8368 / DSM /CCUG 35730 / CIP 100753 / JCM 10117 / KCTC 9821 / NBRC 16120/ NCIMB 702349 / NCTC 13040) OX=521096 GN=Tpau_0037 PE=3 SV=1 [Tsukamurella paurometabola]|uniref:Major facilitator superfamily MFS_1 n=1 Tax=Tsukamurella paurometabola (strain ATCC 8368 / DSM 20162 / CCUG 35730 / CIP 100753 / JCM 10117 / KCTC 9821 / NBRC 16120 / NCIMB 702349 / NCTC 13040) TaxID=521096 RepID=D5UPS3_TSUPD|nr:MFS transporter [Tsukamurella paurometabola]ADG76691.1 major facilitator superfamily MFS_1 [Tsukamurella paurometabola DSM 20162]SUP41238.1 Galactose transporter [Tsukamurella paurometabola]
MVARIALIVALGSFTFGYDLGSTATALGHLARQWNLTATEFGFTTAALPAAATVSALVAGELSDRVTPITALTVSNLALITGSVASACAPNYQVMIGARLLLGAGIGAMAALTPLFLRLLAPPGATGRYTALHQAMIAAGYAGATAATIAFGADATVIVLLLGSIAPAIVLFNAKAIAARIPTRPVGVPTGRGGTIRWPAVAIAVLQQLTGISVLVYYAPTVLQQVGASETTATALLLGISMVSIASCVAAGHLADRYGRVPLLQAGAISLAVSMTAIGLAFQFQSLASLAAATAVVLIVFPATWGALAWTAITDLAPPERPGRTIGAATTANWVATAVLSWAAPLLISGRSPVPTVAFVSFGSMSVCAGLWVRRALASVPGPGAAAPSARG